jgi:subtilisin family serine protease
MIRRRAVLGALSAVVASVVVTLMAGGGVAAESNTNLRAAAVHPTLLDQLQAKPAGGVTAIVTAWGRDGLDEIKQAGVDGMTLRVLPMVITTSLTSEQLKKLESSPAVRSVWPEEKFQTHMEDTTWITKARYVWASSPSSGPLKGYGVTGKGIELAMIDTGFDGLHEDGDNLIEFCDTTGIAMGTSNRRDVRCTPWDEDFNDFPAGACGAAHGPDPAGPAPPPGGAPPSTGPCSNPARGDSQDPDVSHGTHVGGTILGTGHASGGKRFNHSTIGMAPDAKFRAYSANVGLSLLNTQILAAYDDMTYKKEQGYSRVIAVNNSWGGGGGSNYNPNDPQHVAFKRAYAAGIVSVFSAGNSGPEHNTLGAQCVNPFVVCVAANTKPDQVVAFSSKGRPSQPSDTNRDGQINNADVPPDNHDRLLGQRLELGLYRPTLTAPGVAINSMKAIGLNIGSPDSATCREDFLISEEVNANCYVQAQGTSMSAPHVTGAIGLIGEAFRQERGRVPRPAEIIDILERSANTTKLPGWEAEEQGAGRLDVHQAVRLAKGDISLRRPNFGHPTPPYVTGSYGTATTEFGCTGTLSWSARSTPSPGDLGVGPVVPEPVPTGPRYGQHFITVPANTERLRITIRWPNHPTANLYGLLWRPGVNPDNLSQTPDAGPPPNHTGRPSVYFQTRAFPDQEATGIPTGTPPTYRLVEVRAPEETGASPSEGGDPPAIPSGKWVLRVYHRVGGAGGVCPTPSTENPPQTEGFEYSLRIETPRVTYRPSAKITSALTGIQDERFVPIEGRAGYPPPDAPLIGNVGHPWEGVTNWEVPGSAGPAGGHPGLPPGDDERPEIYFHGHPAAPHAETREPVCTGDGRADLALAQCQGPFLIANRNLANSTPSASWKTVVADNIVDGAIDRTIYDPNWVWCLSDGPYCPPGTGPRPGTVTVSGVMTVVWWASCVQCGVFQADWMIRLWADGRLAHEERVTATPGPVPTRLESDVVLPTEIRAEQRIVLHIDPVFINSQAETQIYYDSQNGCTTAVDGPCESHVRMPVGSTGGGPTPPPANAGPENVRVTDLPAHAPYPAAPTNWPNPALRVAWDPQAGATSYRVHRSTNPAFIPSSSNRVYSGPGEPCPGATSTTLGTSPEAPSDEAGDPPGHDRPGFCYLDRNVSLLTTYYYRVVAVRQDGTPTAASEVSYGAPTKFDRQVKLKVDRLYGPQFWEYALVPPSPTPSDTTNTGVQWEYLWDTLELTGAHRVFARSFTQGIGSTKDGKTTTLDDDGGGGGGPGPGCPDDDDGDGDDDDDDGDSDDDGDDRDDDCEDDDDHEEEDDD